jgi:hypothetical protein
VNVTAIIVTRGDHDLGEILDSLPDKWEVVIWDNGARRISIRKRDYPLPVHLDTVIEEFWDGQRVRDLSVYGRYAAIEYATHDLIYVQDDDVIVSDPQAIVNAYTAKCGWALDDMPPKQLWFEGVVCNMPPEFRHDFYEEHALVGFGACFHRDAPKKAHGKFARAFGVQPTGLPDDQPSLLRTCDIVFTALTPRVLVDVSYERLPWDSDPNRMWKQADHTKERTRMLELVKQVAR